MNKLTTELLEKFVSDIKTDGMCDITDYQVESALIQLLAYEQAAKNPVAWTSQRALDTKCQIVAFTDKDSAKEYGEKHGWEVISPVFLSAPVLPKLPETQFDEIALDTAREIMRDVNQRHELIGGECQLLARIQCRINDILCNVAAPAQPVIPEQNKFRDLSQPVDPQISEYEKIMLQPDNSPVIPDAYVLDELGRMTLNGVCEPRVSFGSGWNACRAEMLKAQPVSEPYKFHQGWIKGQFAYQDLFNAIGAAVVSKHPSIEISVKAFENSMLAAAPAQEQK